MGRNKYLIIRGSAKDNIEAIKMCGEKLCKEGLVKESFTKKCQEREVDFPTGLPTEIPVAIPHCKDEGIKENSICFLKLEKPVIFRRMDDDTQDISTDMIFNMAIKDPNEHLAALQSLMKFLNNKEALEKCRTLSDKELIEYFEKNIG